MSIEPGQVIDGKYRILRVLGTGGMGAVYEGENVRIGRRVAIKVLHAEAAHAPDLRRRFEREARVAAKIGSSNICDVLDLGDLPSGHAYLVMEYLEGEGLDTLMTREPRLQAHEISPIVVQLLDGLSAMHGANIVHRDLKPANVFLTNNGIVKILDFGISKFQAQTEEMGQQTETGALLGTPLYMSPEQSRGTSGIDGRSDIYCVGVILYRALSGHHCFEAENLPQLLFKTALEAPIPLLPRVDAIDQSFVPIVEKALAKAPADRYATAREMRDAIDIWLREHHPEVVLPPAPARFDEVLETSGSRARAETSGSHPRVGGAGARPRFEGQSGTPTALPKAPSTPPVTPLPAEGHDTAVGWEKVPVGASVENAAEIALAKTTASSPPPATTEVASVATPPTRASKTPSAIAIGAVVVLCLGGAAIALGKGSTPSQASPTPPSPPVVESAVAVAPSFVSPSATSATFATSTAEAAPPLTGAPTLQTRPVSTAATAAHGGGPGPKPTAAKASASPVATAAPPVEAPSATKPGRKIRTEL